MQSSMLTRAAFALLFLGNVASAQRLYVPIRGVNVHAASGPELDAVTQMHFNWVRMDFQWDSIQPSQYGSFYWEETDRAVEAAVSRGIRVYAGLGRTPNWACNAPDSGVACVPRSIAEWQSFVRAVSGRYRGAIGAYALWNEPDLLQFWHGDAAQYANIILRPGAQAIRAIDPTAIIAAPDLSGSWGANLQPSWIFDAMTSVNAAALIDVVSLHSYPESNLPGPNGVLDKVFSGNTFNHSLLYWVDRNGDLTSKPIWITEFGFDQGGNDPPSGGTAVEQVFELFGPRDRIAAVFDYELIDNSGYQRGLLYASGLWKTGAFYLRDHMPYDSWVPDPPILMDRFDYPWSALLHRWSLPAGAAQIQNGALTSSTQGFAAKIRTLPQADFSIETTARLTNSLGLSTNWIGLLGRTPSMDGTYLQGGYLGLLRANGQAVLYSAAGLSLSAQTNVDPASSYVRLRLTGVGSRISLSVNGVEVLVANDTAYPSGYAGLQNWALGTNDNVVLRSPSSQNLRPEPLAFFPLTPCRLIDTRTPSGGSVSITSGLPVRRFQAWDSCGIPTRAVSLVGNFTAVDATGAGKFHAFPAGYGLPASWVVAFSPYKTRAGFGFLYINAPVTVPGKFDVYFEAAPGNSANFIFDVSGFFAPLVGQ